MTMAVQTGRRHPHDPSWRCSLRRAGQRACRANFVVTDIEISGYLP
jgi:hypothetical protein